MFVIVTTLKSQVCKILQYINSLLSALVKAEYWDLALRLFLQSALICDLMGIQTAGFFFNFRLWNFCPTHLQLNRKQGCIKFRQIRRTRMVLLLKNRQDQKKTAFTTKSCEICRGIRLTNFLPRQIASSFLVQLLD